MKCDVFFLSYQESNATENWQHLMSRYPKAQRLHGVTGIKKAHQRIAEAAKTDFFFVIDGDNRIESSFDFSPPAHLDKHTLYVWRAKNPINDLCYGFGGIKLYNKWLLLENTKSTSVDIATSIAPKYAPVMIVGSTTYFNASPLESWRAGFRETAKLTLNTLKNPQDTASLERLKIWTTRGEDRPFGRDCLQGAHQGHRYALENHQNETTLAKLNDFDWLNQQKSNDTP